MTNSTVHRLPAGIRPKHYTITFAPNLENFSFTGKVAIKLQVDEETDRIVLHSLDLILNQVILKKTDGTQQIPKQIILSRVNETAQFVFLNSIESGNYKLSIEFSGEINDRMMGFYRSKSLNQNGDVIYSVVTQLAPADARRCFPCWDEPAFKSTFDIDVLAPKPFVAISNMPIKSANETNCVIHYKFETSPIMSTYLVAVVVGEYDYVESRSADNVVVRVYTPIGKKEQGLFSLQVATKILPYYKEYFNIPYPLPKMDLIAIADFATVAMENWGLLTFQESGLLVDANNTSALQKQTIATLVGHEISHQWFGNLVTTDWWTNIWLNEGYANFVQNLCVDYLFPEYDIWTQFANISYTPAMDVDSLHNSHPIEVPICNSSEIGAVFDDISYDKGASVIRMLHHYIGDKDFRKGMHSYLDLHKYKNTSTSDLWAALEEASHKSITDIMSTWTTQLGFPLVKVCSKLSNDGKEIVLSLTQTKFVLDGSSPSKKYLWKIPISISTSSKPKVEVVNIIFDSEKLEVTVLNVPKIDWIKLNPGMFGFYRTLYSNEMLQKLTPAIKDKSLPPLDRFNLLSDVFAMAQAGYTSTVELLKLLQAYDDETDYTVWTMICKILTKLGMLLEYTDCKNNFIKFQKKLLSKISQDLKWNLLSTDTHSDILLRGLLLEHLSGLGDERLIVDAKKQFNSQISNGSILPADLRTACYKFVFGAEKHAAYKRLLEMYLSTDFREEKERIGNAFGATEDEFLINEILHFSLSDGVHSQDALPIITSFSSSKVGRLLAWQYFKEHQLEFLKRYQGSFIFHRTVKSLIENFVTIQMADEVEMFFKVHSFPGTERAVKQAVEIIRLNAAWLSRDTATIQSFLIM